MKNILFILIALTFFSCKKELEIAEVTFDVAANTNKLSLGDTTFFTFKGNADMITFWSGEIGKRYEFRDRVEATGTPILRFRSKIFHAQTNTLSVLISTDFAGVAKATAGTISNISSANWVDITSRAQLSAVSSRLTSSGPVNLSDFAGQNKPVYVAFKYKGLAGYPLNRWEIDSLFINNHLPDGTTYEIGNFNSFNAPYTNYGVTTYNPGFVFYNVSNTLTWFNSTINSRAGIVFRTDATGLTADAEAWAILGPINLKKVTPDNGVVIKGLSQNINDLKYGYKYPSNGVFNPTFVGAKTNSSEQNYANKQLTLTIQ